MSDPKDLEILVKALERAVATSSTREPWQEHFERTASVNQSDVLNTDIIQGFSGGWASSYNYGDGVANVDMNAQIFGSNVNVPIPARAKTHKLGQPGVSDVDFVPYNWRTNRYGSKGPALIGNPISYEVLGPTAKSPFTDWTWKVTFEGGPNGGDLLEMDVRPDGTAAVATDLQVAYGVALFDITTGIEPNGGLYLIVSVDGSSPGSIPAGTRPFVPKEPYVETARYQIFRVLATYAIDTVAVTGSIELHPSKKLSTYFDIEGQAVSSDPGHLRSITLIVPYVTRLIAIPGSGEGVGREQTHVFVPPHIAAKPDNYPPSTTWISGGFEPTGLSGSTTAYEKAWFIPIPIPQRQLKGTLLRSASLPGTLELGEFDIVNIENGNSGDTNKIVHIYHVEVTDTNADVDVRTILGWYDIQDIEALDQYKLTRMVEVDPVNGKPFFGPVLHIGNFGEVKVYFTIHENIKALWTTLIFDIDKVEAARLRHLIDPRKVERSDKLLSYPNSNLDISQPRGATPARGDRAIFNTKTFDNGGAFRDAEDPGSLQDLGFRVVLYPGKLVSTDVVPDFDKPIRSREVLLDPDVVESQFVDIDYAAGVVRLSHAPTIGTSDISPNGIVAGDNPRNESVLFAACVPFSQEPSQRGGGSRITCKDPVETDVFSDQIVSILEESNSTSIGSAPFYTDIALADDLTNLIPETGMFNIVGLTGITTGSFGTWSYSNTRVQDFGSGDVTVLEEISSARGATDPFPIASLSEVIFRREITFGIRSADLAKETDEVWLDRTYGSALRASTVRFEDSTCKYELDGSVTVTTSSSGTNIAIEDNGTPVLSNMTTLNFIGAGVVPSDAGGGQANITIEGSIEVQDETVSIVPNARFLNFEGAGVTAAINGIGVDVTIPGGAGGADWTLIGTEFIGAGGGTITTITFSGLDSENDGIYCMIGRAIVEGVLDLVIEPGGISTDMNSIAVEIDETLILASVGSNNWFISTVDPLSIGDERTIFFTAYIYPKKAENGSTNANAGYRLGTASASVFLDNVSIAVDHLAYQSYSRWKNDINTFNFIDVVCTNFIQGTNISLYKINK